MSAPRGRWAASIAGRATGEVREAILAAAAARFARAGFAATAMAEVAEDARVGKATIYQHFPAKEDLLLECCDRRLAVARSRIVAAAAGADPVAALERAVEAARQEAAGDGGAGPRLLHDLRQALAARPELLAAAQARWRAAQAETEAVLAGLVRAGIAGGAFRRDADPAQAGRLLAALADGLAGRDADGPAEIRAAVALLRPSA